MQDKRTHVDGRGDDEQPAKRHAMQSYVSRALSFRVMGRWGKARAALLQLPHFECRTPMFMPVGTQGTVKGLTCDQLRTIGCQVILGNTYHLGLRPGADLIGDMGGLHSFMDWDRGILTDSGGFQMVSLLKLANITEEGVRFESPHDSRQMLLTPEESIRLQNRIGADIIMALDDVVSSTLTGPRVEEAMHRTLRWIDRCIKAHSHPDEQNLFGIVQGGLDARLRDLCLEGMIARDLPGYAIGGLSGGEEKAAFWRIVHQCTSALPFHKPRYLMGVGYPVDMVVCIALGVDMFDCVYPSRTARFGTALVPTGILQLRKDIYTNDPRPIDETCSCCVCKRYTRSHLNALSGKEAAGAQLITYHNLHYQMRLMESIRSAILDGTFPEFVRTFMHLQFPREEDIPVWVREALEAVEISL